MIHRQLSSACLVQTMFFAIDKKCLFATRLWVSITEVNHCNTQKYITDRFLVKES